MMFPTNFSKNGWGLTNHQSRISKDRMPIASGGGIAQTYFVRHSIAALNDSSDKNSTIQSFGCFCGKTMNKMLNVVTKLKNNDIANKLIIKAENNNENHQPTKQHLCKPRSTSRSLSLQKNYFFSGTQELKYFCIMEQLNLFAKINSSFGLIKIPNGEYLYVPSFFESSKADYYFQKLNDEIVWKQEEMIMYGKSIKFPRLTAWYGDNDKPYSFSGIILNPKPWTSELIEIKRKIETKCNVAFNSVLLNLYRNGKDSISWHTDAEKELGRNPVIASVNFGATRKFQLRHQKTKQRIELELCHGSLLIMQGELQHYWQHQVPKTNKEIGQRINLTFRVIK